MADSFTLIREDRFSGYKITDSPSTLSGSNGASDKQKSVRRPLLGMEHKEERYAVLRIISSANSPQNLINTSADQDQGSTSVLKSYTSNLLIQSIQESREEKSQVIQTFGNDFVYFFGERPIQIQISAQLLDSNNFRWHQEWWENYSKYLRGTQVVRRDSRIYLEVQDTIYEGYITRASTSKTADNPRLVSLNFSMLVTNKIYMRPIRNRYTAADTISAESLTEMAKESTNIPYSTQFSAAENTLIGIKKMAVGIESGVPKLNANQSLNLDFVGPQQDSSQVNNTDRIKDLAAMYSTMYKEVLKASTETFYKSSIGEYPNRGLTSNTSKVQTGDKIIQTQNFAGAQQIYQGIEPFVDLGSRSATEIAANSALSQDTESTATGSDPARSNGVAASTAAGIATRGRIGRRRRNKIGRVSPTRFGGIPTNKENSTWPRNLTPSDVIAIMRATRQRSSGDGTESTAGTVLRGVYADSAEISVLEGRVGQISDLENILGDVQALVGKLTQYGLVAANLYMAVLAGQALIEGVGDFLTTPVSFSGSVARDPIIFDSVQESASVVESTPVIIDTPSGSSTQYDPDLNPTPYRETLVIEEPAPSDDDEVIYIQPDFSIFSGAGINQSNDIIILE
jgi:hypothetical protein